MATITKPRVAHLAGPTATIQNTPPLVTSNKARAKYGLPPQDQPRRQHAEVRCAAAAAAGRAGEGLCRAVLGACRSRPTRPSSTGRRTAISMRPGRSTRTRRSDADKPVYEVELQPEDGLYPLPYMARQADGSAWEEECPVPLGVHAAAGLLPRRLAQLRGDRPHADRRRWRRQRDLGAGRCRLLPRRCRRRASPRACPRASAPTRRRRHRARDRGATISSPTSPSTCRRRRRARRSPRPPTTCRR